MLPQNDEDGSTMGGTEREKKSTPDCTKAERLFITGGLRMDFLTPAVLLCFSDPQSLMPKLRRVGGPMDSSPKPV